MAEKKKVTMAALAAEEIADLRERIYALENLTENFALGVRGDHEDDDEPEEQAVKDLTDTATVLILVEGNAVKAVHSNVPGLEVIVHDADIIADPSLVEQDDLNQTGVTGIAVQSFDDLDFDISKKVDDELHVNLPYG